MYTAVRGLSMTDSNRENDIVRDVLIICNNLTKRRVFIYLFFKANSETTILSTGTVITAGAAAIRSIAGLVLLLAAIIGCIVYKKRHSKKRKLEEKVFMIRLH